jgi:hypothetical protein
MLRSMTADDRQTALKKDERRKHERYSWGFAVVLRWKDSKGDRITYEGLTRDISAQGMFVFATNWPPKGAAVHYDVFLPPRRWPGPGLRIGGTGQVVRVESVSGAGRRWSGLALRFRKQRMIVLNGDPKVRSTNSNASTL